MKITVALFGILLKLNPEKFKVYVVYERGRKVIYVVLLRSIYGMLVASLLCYHKFNKYMKSMRFVFHNYGPCVVNIMDNKKQHTV